MKKPVLFFVLMLIACTGLRSQQVKIADLIGTWDQNIKKYAATIIFVDNEKVRFSYKGRTGTSKNYYYLLDASNTPTLLTVDFKPSHRKHRNEYLIELLDKNTMKLQVLHKHDSRSHFDEEHPGNIVTLIRRSE